MESRAELAPERLLDEQGLARHVPSFPVDDDASRLAATSRVTLRPIQLSCPLPRSKQGRPAHVAGWARPTLAVGGGGVAIVSVSAEIQHLENGLLQSRPRLLLAPARAVEALGSLYVVRQGRKAEALGSAFEAYRRTAGFDDALDLRAVTDALAIPLLRSSNGAYASEGTHGVHRGRFLCRVDPKAEPAIDCYAARLDGAAEPYVLVVARIRGDLEHEDTRHEIASLRLGLEHLVAHRWLVDRAQRLNSRALGMVKSSLLNPNLPVREINERRYRLLDLQSEYLDRVDRAWSFGLDLPVRARPVIDAADAGVQLREAWRHERARYDQVRSIADSASGLTRNVHRIASRPANKEVEELRRRHNPFAQVWTWLRGGAARHDPGADYIEKHPEDNRFALFEEVQASLAMTTFMTATSVVFLGLVLGDSVDREKGEIVFGRGIPEFDILFLFIASFGFLFATLVYSNASGQLARIGTHGFEPQMELGNSVSEYLGVYPLLFAIPLTVARYIDTGLVSIAVAILAIIAFAGYHYAPHASLLERDICIDAIGGDLQRKILWIPLLLAGAACLYAGALADASLAVYIGGGWLLALTVLFFIFSIATPERPDPTHFKVDKWDALGEEAKSRNDPEWRKRLREQRLGHRT